MATATKDSDTLCVNVALVQIGDGDSVVLPWTGEDKDPNHIKGLEEVDSYNEIIFGFLLSDMMSDKEIDSLIKRMEDDLDLQGWVVEIGEVPAFGPEGTGNADCAAAEASWQAALDRYIDSQKKAEKNAKAKKNAKQTRAAGARKAKAGAKVNSKAKSDIPAAIPPLVYADLQAAETDKDVNTILKTATGQTLAPIRKAVQTWLDGPKDSFTSDADFRRGLSSFLKKPQKAIRDGSFKADELDAATLFGVWAMVDGKDGVGQPLRPKKRLAKK